MIGLGAYPALSLADARQIRAEKLAILAKEIDPQSKDAEETEQKQIAQESIFLNVAKLWFALKQAHLSADHAKDIWRSIEKDILPFLGCVSCACASSRCSFLCFHTVSVAR